jgi:HEAT repeat protein
VTLNTVIVIALDAFAGLLVLLAVVIVVRKSFRTAATRRRDRVEAIVRPRLMELLALKRSDLTALTATRGADGRVLDSVTASLLTKLRGEDRETIIDLLDVRGVLDAARQATRGRNPLHRARAAEMLGTAAKSSSFDDLHRLLADGHSDVRDAAVRALGRLGMAEAVQPLLEALDGANAVPAGLITMALLHVGPVAEEPLRTIGLVAASRNARIVAARALGVLGAAESATGLVDVLESDPDPQVREAAAFALGRIGAPLAIGPLIAFLESQATSDLASASARALGEIGGAQAIPVLEAAARTATHTVARQATLALSRLGPEGFACLEGLAGGTGVGADHAREAISSAATVLSRRSAA